MKKLIQTRYAAVVLAVFILSGCLAAGSGAGPASKPETAPDFKLYENINADTLRLSDYVDHPVLLLFFDLGNMAQARCFPYAREYDRRYQGDGLKTIGIHCPAFEPFKVYVNALTVAAGADLKFPIGLDMELEVYSKFRIDALPTFIVLKPGGEIVLRTTGTRNFRPVEEAIQQILKDRNPDTILPFLLEPLQPIDDPAIEILKPTPMVLPGYASATLADYDSAGSGKYVTYTDPGDREKEVIYLQGRWKVDEQTISHEQDVFGLDDYIRLVYSGKDVWILCSFEDGKPPKIYIKQDRAFLLNELWGRSIQSDERGWPFIRLRHAVPVHIVKNNGFGAHEIRLVPAEGEFTLHYFYFECAPDPKSMTNR